MPDDLICPSVSRLSPSRCPPLVAFLVGLIIAGEFTPSTIVAVGAPERGPRRGLGADGGRSGAAVGRELRGRGGTDQRGGRQHRLDVEGQRCARAAAIFPPRRRADRRALIARSRHPAAGCGQRLHHRSRGVHPHEPSRHRRGGADLGDARGRRADSAPKSSGPIRPSTSRC